MQIKFVGAFNGRDMWEATLGPVVTTGTSEAQARANAIAIFNDPRDLRSPLCDPRLAIEQDIDGETPEDDFR